MRHGFPKMRADRAISIADFVSMARRRLPRILFETIESGVEDELCLAANEAAFGKHLLLPRSFVDVADRDQSAVLFGARHAAPFGIAPTGIAGVFRRGAEMMLARAAATAGIPLILSGASMSALERVAAIAPGSTWFQLYPARDRAISHDMVRKAADAGLQGLVVTVDNPVYPNRERDKRNGFGLPLRPRLGLLLEALLHPAWLAEYVLGGGLPVMETWAPYAPPGASAAEVATFFRSQSPVIQTWDDLDSLRRLWPNRLIVKGVMHPADAARAATLGVDGIIISNHGGKALDRVPSALDMLPLIRRAVPGHVPVMIDGGVRRGSDVVVALCLGADFVFAGRATLYAVAACGEAGASRAIAILQQEIDLTLALMGCASAAALGPEYLHSYVGCEDANSRSR